jgi:hypothetical protein
MIDTAKLESLMAQCNEVARNAATWSDGKFHRAIPFSPIINPDWIGRSVPASTTLRIGRSGKIFRGAHHV